MTYRKKLIEVVHCLMMRINAASAREKSIRRGHPSTLHPTTSTLCLHARWFWGPRSAFRL
ncbi:MAG: DUF1156 domain-containing protein [Geminicoccaceae bacterium]